MPEFCEMMWFVEKGEQENAKGEGSEKRPRDERKSPKEGRKEAGGRKEDKDGPRHHLRMSKLILDIACNGGPVSPVLVGVS